MVRHRIPAPAQPLRLLTSARPRRHRHTTPLCCPPFLLCKSLRLVRPIAAAACRASRPAITTYTNLDSTSRLMSLVAGPGRGGVADGQLPDELKLVVDKHVAYIQKLDTVHPTPPSSLDTVLPALTLTTVVAERRARIPPYRTSSHKRHLLGPHCPPPPRTPHRTS